MMTILFGLVVSLFFVLYTIGWYYVIAAAYGIKETKKTIDTSKNKCYNNNVKRGN